ncbi:hypothetical protein RJ639_035934 [Escallonia herrerae]|uniref:Uncharacterized protein n=1 Tax=Escallonia herrerae TaxID=1293975 RepID=A0AA88WS67_9ASTE|nr:hypothetical protein RJ639_035934 [Escallonia herrerae]
MEEVRSEVCFADGDKEDGYDAIVVGSDYGGSVAACRMSTPGLKIKQELGDQLWPKNALLQVYQQDDSVAAMACGLGGGSLVNAGVILPTPVREMAKGMGKRLGDL